MSIYRGKHVMGIPFYRKQHGFFFFDKWKFSLKLEEMLHNGRSKSRVQAVLTEHLTMDITKGRGGNISIEQAVGGYGYALKCMR